MQADYKVNSIYVDEETGEIFAKCYDTVYGEKFEKYLGNPEEHQSSINASIMLEDSNFGMTDELRNEIISTFGLEDLGHEMTFATDEYDDEIYAGNANGIVTEDELDAQYNVEESFNLREALNRIDIATSNKFDLRNLYESVDLRDEDKEKLATLIYDQEDPSVIYDTLNNKFLESIGMNEEDESPIVHKKSDGSYLVAAENGEGYVAYNKSDVCMGNISANNEQEAKNKFNSNKFDESLNKSTNLKWEDVSDGFDDPYELMYQAKKHGKIFNIWEDKEEGTFDVTVEEGPYERQDLDKPGFKSIDEAKEYCQNIFIKMDESLNEEVGEKITSTIDGSELEINEENVIPNTHSFKATYTTGDSAGNTYTFVEADDAGVEYLKSLGFKAENMNGGEFIDLPTECFNGKYAGSYYITRNDFSEYMNESLENNDESLVEDLAPGRTIDVVFDEEDPDLIPYLFGISENKVDDIGNRYDLSEEELWSTGWVGAVQNIEDAPFESFDEIEILCHDEEKGEEYDLPEIPEDIKTQFLNSVNKFAEIYNIDESLTESSDITWHDVYKQFLDIVDSTYTGGNEEEIAKAVEELYRQHDGEPAWDAAWLRWLDHTLEPGDEGFEEADALYKSERERINNRRFNKPQESDLEIDLKNSTNGFTNLKGSVKYESSADAAASAEVLKKHYSTVRNEEDNTGYYVIYRGKLEESLSSTRTFAQWFDETQQYGDDEEFYPFDNYVKHFPNAEVLRNITAKDVVNNAHKFYDVYPVDSDDRMQAFTFAGEELNIDEDKIYKAWMNETPMANLDEGYELSPEIDYNPNHLRDDEGKIMADRWYASKWPDDEVGIEQLQGITLDDALKDRKILDHCDTQVRDRVYAQLDKYIPLCESRPDKDIKTTTNKVTIKYGNSVKEVETCKPIKVTEKQLDGYRDNYSIVNILDESKSIKESSDSGYWYFTRHGVQPGSIPKGANVLTIQDVENGIYVKLDRVLTTKELNDYEIIEKRPEGLDESKSINESADIMIYIFPELTDEDLDMLKAYGLQLLGINHGAYGDEENWVVRGQESSLRMFADKYLGYELHPDYLYDEDNFAGDIEPLKEEIIELTADEMKGRFGTDNPDIINTGRPEEDGTVALKEDSLTHSPLSTAGPIPYAVKLLYMMDRFVMDVYDNEGWLMNGVPDGEFEETTADEAMQNYNEHFWLIEDADNAGEINWDDFNDFIDTFNNVTESRDYDQEERSRIINEVDTFVRECAKYKD